MNTQTVLIRVGELNEEFEKIGSFSADAVTYILLKGKSPINSAAVNYILEIVIEDIIIRRARIGVISTGTRGLYYDFPENSNQILLDWFLATKNSYLSNGDDWFAIAMVIGEAFYTNINTALSAASFESEQRRKLMKINPDFQITFNKLDNVVGDNVKLDDIWMDWDDDEDIPH